MKLDESVIQKCIFDANVDIKRQTEQNRSAGWDLESMFHRVLQNFNLVIKPGDSSQSILVDLKDVL